MDVHPHSKPIKINSKDYLKIMRLLKALIFGIYNFIIVIQTFYLFFKSIITKDNSLQIQAID
jgi:hypothetical protein